MFLIIAANEEKSSGGASVMSENKGLEGDVWDRAIVFRAFFSRLLKGSCLPGRFLLKFIAGSPGEV